MSARRAAWFGAHALAALGILFAFCKDPGVLLALPTVARITGTLLHSYSPSSYLTALAVLVLVFAHWEERPLFLRHALSSSNSDGV